MFARHSFASIARDAGIPESTISQCMGHARGFGITGQYFSDVPDKMLQKVAKALLYFNDELSDIEKAIFAKLDDQEQSKFLNLNTDDREAYVTAYIVNRI